MTTLRQALASGNQILVFEAAARCLSFTEAAAELNVTQPAVSRMIGRFEAHVGLKLFDRSPAGLRLTGDGQLLYASVASGLNGIGQVLEQLQRRRRTKNVITLSVSSAFATHWLIPRFTAFKALHPELELRFQLTGREPGGRLNEADLGVQLDCPDDANVVEHALIPEKIHAVCSPSYASEYGTIASPRSNREITFIRFSHPRVSWRMFFSETGLAQPKTFKELTFSDYSVVVQAALAGQGIALGWSQVTSHAFEAGLLQPACREFLVTGDSYKLFAAKGSMDRADVCAVADWIIQEMRPLEIAEESMRSRE